ncbi:MFS general substrate transporter [Meredithblackwellia eburnea MCA 4105]
MSKNGSESASEKGEVDNIELSSAGAGCERRNYEASTEEEKRLDRSINIKFDAFISALLGICFLLCGLDKTNIGNAATTTFIKDAHLGANDVGNAVSLFSATFVVLQPFSVSLGRFVGPRYYIPFLMVSWAAMTMAHAAINNRATLVGLRLALGAFEAGFYPCSIYLITCCYPRNIIATRVGIVSCMFVAGSAFGGLIAYGLFNAPATKLHGWQKLFLVEGGITVFFAILALIMLPNSVGTCWFLSTEEREHATKRMQIDMGAAAHSSRHKTTFRDVKDALTDAPKLIIIIFNLITTLPVSAFGVFLPLILQGMGYAGVRANLMSVPPFIIGALGVLITVIISDRLHDRSILCSLGCLVAMVGLIVMTASKSPKLRYGFTNICMSGAFVAGPLGLAWIVTNTPEPAKRAVLIGINGYSNLAGVIAGQLFQAKYKPSYHYPLTVTIGLLAVPLVGFPIMRIVYILINNSRAKKVANMPGDEIAHELSTESPRRGDQKWTFVYSL